MWKGRLRLIAVALGTALLALALVPLQLVVQVAAPRRRHVLPRLFHAGLRRLAGIRLTVRGQPVRGALLVANHISWTDIAVLGSATGGLFVAKAEVAGWPGIGLLAKLDSVIFVDRARTREAGGQADAIAARLRAGDTVVMFPEGTTSDGAELLPFKTALFAAVAGAGADQPVQPATIRYTALAGRPIGPAEREIVGWTGDESFVEHALRLMNAGRLTAELVLHAPLCAGDYADRKALATACRERIAAGL